MKLLLVFTITLCLSLSEAGINRKKRYEAPVYTSAPVTRDMRAEGCGKPNVPTERIIGGTEAGINEFPWQVAIYGDELVFGAGVLISEEWILTAGHVVNDLTSFRILLGAHNILQPEENSIQIVATEHYAHPDYTYDYFLNVTLTNDVGLIKLPYPITFTDNIRPICLPAIPADINQLEDHTGESEVVVGWGLTSLDSGVSPVLNKASLTIISREECLSGYNNDAVLVNEGVICASTKDGKGTCAGDSGGPVSHVEADGVFTQIGVVSFGSTPRCEVGAPVGFSNVEYFRQWITEITNINFV